MSARQTTKGGKREARGAEQEEIVAVSAPRRQMHLGVFVLGTGNHSAGCLRSRGMTPARASEDLPLPEAPSSSASRGASRPWRRNVFSISSVRTISRPR